MALKISFVIPVYNAGAFLYEAIQSIKDQELPECQLEIVIVDDKSSDPETIRILAQIENWPGIFLVRQEQNGGPARARNAGIRAAKGDWIAFLDADDLLAPDAIRQRLSDIQKNPKCRWLLGDVLEIRAPGQLSHENHFGLASAQGVKIGDDTYVLSKPVDHMLQWNALPVLGAMMIHRSVFNEIGLLGETLTYGEDIHFCLLLAGSNDLYWVARPYLYLRRYHESMTKDTFRGACAMPSASRLLLREKKLRPYRKKLRWMHAANLRLRARAHRQRGNTLNALLSAIEAIRWVPNDMRNVYEILQSLRAPFLQREPR